MGKYIKCVFPAFCSTLFSLGSLFLLTYTNILENVDESHKEKIITYVPVVVAPFVGSFLGSCVFCCGGNNDEHQHALAAAGGLTTTYGNY